MELTETTRTILTQFTDEVIGMLLATLAFLFLILFIYRLYVRRRLKSFFHQIPASEVKNYLDSIISNGHALKSSFSYREGFDLDNRTPSVLPLADLPLSGTNTETKIPSEELSQKDAEIASLKSQIGEKTKTVRELEEMLSSARENGGGDGQEAERLKNELQEMKSQLEKMPDDKSEEELQNVVQERNKFKERLEEYELIEEDLANLKTFQEENQKLKKELEALRNRPVPEDNMVYEAAVNTPTEEIPLKENPPQKESVDVVKESAAGKKEVSQKIQDTSDPSSEESLQKVLDVTEVIDDPTRTIKGEKADIHEKESLQKVLDVTEVTDDPTKIIKGEKAGTDEEESLQKIFDATEVIDDSKKIVKGEKTSTDENVVQKISGENIEHSEDNELTNVSETKSLSEVLDENAISDLDDDPIEDLKADELEKEEAEVPANEGNQKSAEELLSEFEKMLG